MADLTPTKPESAPETPAQNDVQKISDAREKLKAENDLYEAEKLRGEKLRAEKILDGRSSIAEPRLTEKEQQEQKAKKMADELILLRK